MERCTTQHTGRGCPPAVALDLGQAAGVGARPARYIFAGDLYGAARRRGGTCHTLAVVYSCLIRHGAPGAVVARCQAKIKVWYEDHTNECICGQPKSGIFMNHSIIVWRRLDQAGLEYCELASSDSGHRLSGVVVGVEDSQRYHAEYVVRCDPQWQARDAEIRAALDGEERKLRLQVRSDGVWELSGQRAEHLSGCNDIDLACTPATNTIALRRLKLGVGSSAASRAAYVSFPEMTVSVLEQTYQRLSEATYRYETDDGSFGNTLTVNKHGLVTSYPPFWEEVA